MSAPHRPFAERLPRRRRKSAWLFAVAGPLGITFLQWAVGTDVVPPAAVLLVTLLVVVVVALLGGVGPALASVAVGLAAQEVIFEFPYGSLNDHEPIQVTVLVVFVVIAVGIGLLVDELVWLHSEQTALRRLATLVARGVPPPEVFAAVAEEVVALLAADSALVLQLDPDGAGTVLAVSGDSTAGLVVGERWPIEPPLAVAEVVRTGRPARVDDYEHASAEVKERLRNIGIRASIATPIVVEGRLWGAVVVSSLTAPLPRGAEQRLLDFTELVATAVANAESRFQLAASRARIVAASDETRRRVERDLHDGVQQRLVSLALEVRAAQSALPPAVTEVREELTRVVDGLNGALEELREIARGIHPAILSEGGLGPALRTLARRAPVPVALDIGVDDTLSDGVEVAVYYAVSELIANTAKHARASRVDVAVMSTDGVLRIAFRDDGVGGADPARGSGLVGLRDRIEALGGTISVQSPKGDGTSVEVALPLSG